MNNQAITVKSLEEADKLFLKRTNGSVGTMTFRIKPSLFARERIVIISRNQPIVTIELNKITEAKGEQSMNNNLVQQHKEYCDNLNKVYAQKNEKYGDSFGISVRQYGNIAALTRISDKFHRMEQLILSRKDGSDTDERLEDTLLDMANYCIMTAMELKNKEEN